MPDPLVAESSLPNLPSTPPKGGMQAPPPPASPAEAVSQVLTNPQEVAAQQQTIQQKGIIGAGLFQVLGAAGDTALRMFLASRGYIHPGMLKDRTLSDVILDNRKMFLINRTLFSGLDNRPLISMVDAVLVALGVDPNRVPLTDKLELFARHYPSFSGMVYLLLGEKTYDALFGRAGSPMLLAKAIIEAYGPTRIDGNSAVNLATALHMVFSMNPALTKGFHGEELSKVLQDAVRQGLITPTVDANVFIRQALNVLPLYGSIRDALKKTLKRDPTAEEITEVMPKFVESLSGMPFPRMAQEIRRHLYISSLSPYGLFHAGVQAAGIQVPISPEVYVKDDLTLRQNILDSPVGNMVGATARIIQMYGKRGPLAKFYEDVLAGRMPVITPGQWIEMAVRSGVPAPMAFTLLMQHARNKSFLTPDLIQGIRAAQFNYDIAPLIDQINALYPDPELRAGAIAEMAQKLGYKGVGNIDPGTYMMLLHSNAIHQGIKKVLIEADHYSTIEEASSHYQGFEPLRSVADTLRSGMLQYQAGQKPQLDLGKLIGAPKLEEFGVPRTFVLPPVPKVPQPYSLQG